MDVGIRVLGLGFGVYGVGIRVLGLGFGAYGAGVGVSSLDIREAGSY